nr:hypothetical protein [Tanacetum cinerariifolium]
MYLEYGGCMANQLQFDVKSLKKALIKQVYIEKKDEIAIRELFTQVSHVQYLTVNYFAVKEEDLPGSLQNLKTMELTIDCHKMELLIPILKYFPNLESRHLINRM